MSSGFPRENRITRGPDLQRMLREGKRVRTRFLDVRFGVSPLTHSRILRVGIIVPKAKHSSVDRNKLKRRLRELARTMLIPRVGLHDMVLLARHESYNATFKELMVDVRQLYEKLYPDGLETDT